jgi:hypothetical protein
MNFHDGNTWYNVVGFLVAVLREIAPIQAGHVATLLATSPSNASLQRIEPSPEDISFLTDNQRHDFALYETARSRAMAAGY